MSLKVRLKLTGFTLLIFLYVFFLGISSVLAANVFSDNFDSYTAGTSLIGNGWYGLGNIKVNSAFSVSPPNSVYDPGSTFSYLNTPTFTFANHGYVSFSFQFLSGLCSGFDNIKMSLDFNYPSSNGVGFWCADNKTKFKIVDYSQTITLFDHLDFDTTYNFVMEWNSSSSQIRVSVDGGSTFSPWISSALPNITYVSFTRNNSWTNLTFDDFKVFDNPFATIPVEYFAKINDAPSGIAEMRGELDQNGNRELIKTFPNDWVLKVFSDTLTLDGWIKVQDMTDESFGWMQGGFERLPYDATKQEEFGNVSSVLLTTKAERAAKIVDTVNHYYNDNSTNRSLYSSDDNNTKLSLLKNKGFPIELLLAIIAQESGGINYDNEYVTNDFGHGITQATMKNYLNPRSPDFDHRGEYSDVILSKCPLNNLNEYKPCYDPKNIGLIWNEKKKIKELGVTSYKYTPFDYHDYEYNPHNVFDYRILSESEKSIINLNNEKYKQYANTLQSIFSNIKDGLGVLSSRYNAVWVIPCSNNVILGGYDFSCSEISMIKAVWGYNGATIDSPNYLGAVSKRLNTLTTHFNVEPYLNNDNLIEKLAYAGTHRAELKAHSPIEISIKDSEGNVVGVVDGGEVEGLPNSAYDVESERAVIFFPDDTYTYEVVGDSTGGTYGIDINIFNGSEVPLTFNAVNLPIVPGEIHTYQVDEVKLANNAPDAVTVKIDKEGDGVVDRTLKTGNLLNDISPDVTPPELKVTFNLETKDVEFSGTDDRDPNVSVEKNSKSITLKDLEGNTTIIPFTHYKDGHDKLRFSFDEIIRNGVSTKLSNTYIQYHWDEKKGKITDLDTFVFVKGVERNNFEYKKQKNITTIKQKTKTGVTTAKKTGFVPVTVVTNQSNLDISY